MRAGVKPGSVPKIDGLRDLRILTRFSGSQRRRETWKVGPASGCASKSFVGQHPLQEAGSSRSPGGRGCVAIGCDIP